MANFQKSHPENVPGPLFVDLTCIDCGTCFHLGPAIFRENSDDKSIVVKQPVDSREWQEAKRAILSCPTNSIGVKDAPEEFKHLGTGLPFSIEDNVYYLGYTSRDSFGATTYLIQREEGNVLVDSPRFHPWLVKELEKMGGVRWMFLSHQDDVADHEKFHQHFGCERILHQDDIGNDTKNVEKILTGEEDVFIARDLRIVMTPGHTKGHMNLLYKDRFLFTGDHLFVDPEQHKLSASHGVCWYSWAHQIKSVEKLEKLTFNWVMPGHGGWGYFTEEEAKKEIRDLVDRMKRRS